MGDVQLTAIEKLNKAKEIAIECWLMSIQEMSNQLKIAIVQIVESFLLKDYVLMKFISTINILELSVLLSYYILTNF